MTPVTHELTTPETYQGHYFSSTVQSKQKQPEETWKWDDRLLIQIKLTYFVYSFSIMLRQTITRQYQTFDS